MIGRCAKKMTTTPCSFVRSFVNEPTRDNRVHAPSPDRHACVGEMQIQISQLSDMLANCANCGVNSVCGICTAMTHAASVVQKNCPRSSELRTIHHRTYSWKQLSLLYSPPQTLTPFLRVHSGSSCEQLLPWICISVGWGL